MNRNAREKIHRPVGADGWVERDWLLFLLLLLYLTFVAVWIAAADELLQPYQLLFDDNGWSRDSLFALVSVLFGLPIVVLYRRGIGVSRKRLSESEAQLRAVFDSTREAIAIVQSGRILRANRACLSLFSYRNFDELRTRELHELLAADCRSRLEQYLQQSRGGNVAPAPLAARGIRRDGGSIDIELRVSAVELGGEQALIVWFFDLSGRAEYESNLRKSAAYFRALFDENPQMMCLYDMDSARVLAVNRAMLLRYGYSQPELQGMRITDMVALRMVPQLQDIIDQQQQAPRHSGVWETYSKQGELIEVDVVSYPVDYGDRAAKLLIATDVTETRRLQRQWEQSQARMQRLLHADMLAIGLVDEQGVLIDANQLCLSLFQLTRESLEQRRIHWRQLFAVDESDNISTIFRRLRERGQSEPMALRLPGGDDASVLVGAAFLPEGGGMFYAIDITSQVQALTALVQTESAYRQLFEHAPVSLWEEDLSDAMSYVEQLQQQGVADIAACLLDDPQRLFRFWSRIRITHVNRSTLQLLGVDSLEQLRANLSRIITPRSLRDFARIAGALAEGKASFSVETEYRRLDGELVNVAMNWILPGGGGQYHRLVAALTDISEIKRANQQLQKLSLAVEQSGNIVLMTDANGVVEYVNPKFETVTGYRATEVVGHGIATLEVDEQSQGAADAMLRHMLQGEEWHGELNFRRRDGELFWCLITVAPVREAMGDISQHVVVAEDISERKFAESTIRHLAFYDPLTELPNRRLFRDRIEVMANGSMRDGHMFGLLYMDLDRFKTVNDTLGHAIGDRLLQAAARRMQSVLRPGDTLARLGGDEFALVITDLAHADNLADVAEKLIAAMKAPFDLDGHHLFVSVSIGVAVFPQDCEDRSIDTLVKHADVAMYRAKEQGRDTFQFYRPEMNARALERLMLESQLRGAIDRGEFVLHFQPQVELQTGRIVGVEALVRWQSRERGLVSPADFIPLAEEAGLIVPIGAWVMREACRQVQQWRLASLPVERVAVNLSARQIRLQDMEQQIVAALEESGLPAHCLDIEITESLAMEQPERTRALLQRLKQRGITLSMDDFGTGYSSLGYLKQYPLDVLKIDRSFVRDIASDPNDAAIVSTIIAMASHLNLTVLGEGIETEAQRQFLLANGCRFGQGFLFSPPLPPERCEALLRQCAASLPAA